MSGTRMPRRAGGTGPGSPGPGAVPRCYYVPVTSHGRRWTLKPLPSREAASGPARLTLIADWASPGQHISHGARASGSHGM
jgi:hypothetical protein